MDSQEYYQVWGPINEDNPVGKPLSTEFNTAQEARYFIRMKGLSGAQVRRCRFFL